MKFTALPLAVLALGVSATVVDDTPTRVERDLATISQVVTSVQSQVAALDSAVTGFNGGDATSLTDAGNSLLSTITDGVTQVQGTSNISLNDAVSLQSQASGLQTAGEQLVNDLAAKKDQVQQANLCDTIRQQSEQFNSQTQQLIDAITTKVPAEAQSIASQLIAGITATLQQNQANFAQGNCTNASGGSSPSSGTGTSTLPGATTTGSGVSGTSLPTGTTASPSTVATAAAALNAVPLGGLALGFAALLV